MKIVMSVGRDLKKKIERRGRGNKCSNLFKPRLEVNPERISSFMKPYSIQIPTPQPKTWSRDHEMCFLFSASYAHKCTASQSHSFESITASTWWNRVPKSCWNSAESNFWSFQVHNDVSSSLCHALILGSPTLALQERKDPRSAWILLVS